MASRESQGMQVALILFVMVTVVLSITTYLYFKRSEEKIKEADSANKLAAQAKETANTMQYENQILKHVLGYERKSDAELATIKVGLKDNKLMDDVLNNFDQEMATYGAGLAKDDLTYRSLPKRLLETIQDKTSKLVAANAQMLAYQTEKEQARKEEMARAEVATKAQEAAQAELVSERQKFTDDRARVTAESAEGARKMDERTKKFQEQSASMQKEKEDIQKNYDMVAQLAQNFKGKLDKITQDKPTETAAGEVKWVDQRSNMVWINLGTVDGVQRQMTFSVVDQKETVVGKAKVKGRIEVTRVMEDHTAEARIIENQISDPLMVGDKIFSPSFRKGQRIHFALAGTMDINGDGKSDQAKVKSIITMNGGVVDAELMEDGSIAGKMTSDTTYLVQGQKPTDKSNVKLTEGYTRMIGEATSLGITPMTLDKLLDKMGYVPERRVTDLTRGGTGAGKKEDKQFRKRTPGSAY